MENLLELERQARMAGNTKQLAEIHTEIIDSCSSDSEVISTLRSLLNKRKQDHGSIRNIIKSLFDKNKGVEFLEELLKKIIEGKIYLENERIYISEHLKNHHRNNIEEAYNSIKDVPAETFTTISDKDRNFFLFEQFRIALLLHRFEDSELFMRKIRKGYLKTDELIIFLNYCILLKIGQNKLMEASRLYLELNKKDESKRNVAMGSILCMMSSCATEERNVKEERRELLEKLSNDKSNDEGIRIYTQKFCSNIILKNEVADQIIELSRKYTDNINKDILLQSIAEHNFFICEKYFSKIKISQMCSLLEMDENKVIDFISEMVNEKYCLVKINQRDGLVSFKKKEWNGKVDNVLDGLVLASYMIHKSSITKDK